MGRSGKPRPSVRIYASCASQQRSWAKLSTFTIKRQAARSGRCPRNCRPISRDGTMQKTFFKGSLQIQRTASSEPFPCNRRCGFWADCAAGARSACMRLRLADVLAVDDLADEASIRA